MNLNNFKKSIYQIKKFRVRIHINVNILTFVMALICLYAILQIKFGFAFYIGSFENSNNINEIVTNLSYSYLAGYIFFIMTVSLPNLIMKSKIQQALNSKAETIIKNYHACLESVLPLSQNLKEDLSKEEAVNIFKNVSYMDPCRLAAIGQNVCIAKYIQIKHEENQELATQLLEYKTWLSSNSVALIETIRNSSLSKVIIAFMQKPLLQFLNNEYSRAQFADEVYDLWKQSKLILQSLTH